MQLPFDLWLSGYLNWKKEVAKTLGSRLPAEVTELLKERQELTSMRFKAEDFRSDAVGYYYAAKLKHIERLSEEGVAKTALEGMAKAQAYKELWARENAHGVAETVISRAFDVKAELIRHGIPN